MVCESNGHTYHLVTEDEEKQIYGSFSNSKRDIFHEMVRKSIPSFNQVKHSDTARESEFLELIKEECEDGTNLIVVKISDRKAIELSVQK